MYKHECLICFLCFLSLCSVYISTAKKAAELFARNLCVHLFKTMELHAMEVEAWSALICESAHARLKGTTGIFSLFSNRGWFSIRLIPLDLGIDLTIDNQILCCAAQECASSASFLRKARNYKAEKTRKIKIEAALCTSTKLEKINVLGSI
jgi:hypothetical protein